MPARHCIWVLALLLGVPAAGAHAQTPHAAQRGLLAGARPLDWVSASRGGADAARQDSPTAQAARLPDATNFTVFLRGTPVGREEVSVLTDARGTTIISQGRVAGPVNSVIQRVELRYGPDWSPESFVLEGTANGGPVSIETSFRDGSAVTTGESGGNDISVTHTVPAGVLVLPNGVFGAYQAITHRFADAPAGTEFQVYVVPTLEIRARLRSVQTQQMQTGATIFDVRHYELVFANPGGDLTVHLSAEVDGALVRLSIPAQGVDVVREDVAASTARTQVYSNPGDEPVVIPATGFNLGATLTRPDVEAPRIPAVILVGGSGVDDRDGFGLGVPVLGQLAGALADAGFLVVRYDKRGYGQSGGRAESATLTDHADDMRTVVRWLRNRRDVDSNRVAVIGHAEGAWIALLATSRERRVAAVAALAGPATTGAELLLEQQQRMLDQMTLSATDRENRVELQERIQAAVLTGRGWEDLPAELRRHADTPWFQSLLSFDPARVVDGIRQPLLIVHGDVDQQVPVAHADRLATLARRSRAVEVVIVRGVDHLLIPAGSRTAREDVEPAGRDISDDVTMSIATWLMKTFATSR
jgi:pimeloyl-ACP methyl ester carboxylesterase